MSVSHKILMVVTSHDRIDAGHATGLWLEEFATPYREFEANGFAVTVASPKGGPALIDPGSESDNQDWIAAREVLKATLPLSQVQAADYEAIFLPGGHGTMFDLPGNPDLQRLLADFAEEDKLIAAVCHGPAGFVGAKRRDGTPLVAGQTLTAFTNSEERAAHLDQQMPFLLESRLQELGALFVARPDWADHIEQSGRLITGQNPQSSASVAQAIAAALTPIAR